MKKFILLTLSSTLLVGCGAVQQARLDSGLQQAAKASEDCFYYAHVPQQEANAWIKSSKDESIKQCSAGLSEPWPREKMMEISQCATAYFNKNIKPYVHSQSRFKEYMDAREKSHRDYADGKISWEELERLADNRWADYIGNANAGSLYTTVQCRNAALQQFVMPTYPHKSLLMSFMSYQSELGMKVDKGDMTFQEADIATQQAFAALLGAEQQANAAIQQQNAQAWQQSFENLQKLEQSNSSSRPKNTNCNVWRNTMNCTSW